VVLDTMVWADGPVGGRLAAQCSAHGAPRPATVEADGPVVEVRFDEPHRRVAPGQSVVLYDGDAVVGGGIATAAPAPAAASAGTAERVSVTEITD
jgi:tRNA-specific 2-thiouridylase